MERVTMESRVNGVGRQTLGADSDLQCGSLRPLTAEYQSHGSLSGDIALHPFSVVCSVRFYYTPGLLTWH